MSNHILYQLYQHTRKSADEIKQNGNEKIGLQALVNAEEHYQTRARTCAKSGDYRLYRLSQRFNGRELPEVDIVDMKEELKMGNDLSLSYPLREAIHDTAAAGKQTILLLNRRGNSRALVCVDCRETPECPRCAVRLTYHSANNRLMCHYCGHSQPVPQRCPTCGGPLKTMGLGTQKVEQEVSLTLPFHTTSSASSTMPSTSPVPPSG